jgi:hypothetical protein
MNHCAWLIFSLLLFEFNNSSTLSSITNILFLAWSSLLDVLPLSFFLQYWGLNLESHT